MKTFGPYPQILWGLALVLTVTAASPALASTPGRVAATRVSEDNYRHYLDDMLYAHDGDDRHLSGAEHDLARDNIAMIMSSIGLDVELDPFELNGDTLYNVVGTMHGTTYPEQEYIIGAHYDSVNWEDPENGAPGADDNASGVALILEAARVLSTCESEYTIRFIAFDAEEGYGAGSGTYVQDHLDDDILAMISCDMVSYDNGSYSVQIEARQPFSSQLQEAVGLAVDMYGGDLGHNIATGGGSDNDLFEQAGIPACLVIESGSNPHWHKGSDSVDTPCYIDYAYATQVTRAVVGFLVDHAGIDVPVPDADHDADGDVDADDHLEFEACFAPDIPPIPECVFFDFEADGDVDCGDWALFEAVWTGPPSEPPINLYCIPLLPSVAGAAGRCIAVMPAENAAPMALRIRGWHTDLDVHCISQYVQPDGRLGPSPVYQTHDAWGTIAVCDENIIPGASYIVEAESESGGAPSSSARLCVIAALWGDTVGDFIAGEWTRPNGVIDFNDISSVVDAFRHLPSAPLPYRVELVGPSGNECSPDLTIDFLDISAAVEAFKGKSYTEATSCPLPCD